MYCPAALSTKYAWILGLKNAFVVLLYEFWALVKGHLGIVMFSRLILDVLIVFTQSLEATECHFLLLFGLHELAWFCVSDDFSCLALQKQI